MRRKEKTECGGKKKRSLRLSPALSLSLLLSPSYLDGCGHGQTLAVQAPHKAGVQAEAVESGGGGRRGCVGRRRRRASRCRHCLFERFLENLRLWVLSPACGGWAAFLVGSRGRRGGKGVRALTAARRRQWRTEGRVGGRVRAPQLCHFYFSLFRRRRQGCVFPSLPPSYPSNHALHRHRPPVPAIPHLCDRPGPGRRHGGPGGGRPGGAGPHREGQGKRKRETGGGAMVAPCILLSCSRLHSPLRLQGTSEACGRRGRAPRTGRPPSFRRIGTAAASADSSLFSPSVPLHSPLTDPAGAGEGVLQGGGRQSPAGKEGQM